MNRRGDLPTMLLFVSALVLSILALFSFASFDDTFSEGSMDRSSMLSDVEFYQNYLIKESKIVGREIARMKGGEGEFKKLMLEKDFGIVGLEGFFERIKDDKEFEFIRVGEKYSFKMKNVVVVSERGVNRIERNFDIDVGDG
jgi:hypothetical protein